MPSRHPLLAKFVLDYGRLGPSVTFARSADGNRVIDTVLARDPFTALIGAIDAAPTRPPQPALDRYLLAAVGIDACNDEAKILVGRVIRQAIEHIGGHHVRKGVPVIVASVFANGSIYHLPSTVQGKLDATARRTWAEQQVSASALPA